jgi:hypothetical protein
MGNIWDADGCATTFFAFEQLSRISLVNPSKSNFNWTSKIMPGHPRPEKMPPPDF